MVKIKKMNPKTYGVQPELLNKFAENPGDEETLRKMHDQAMAYINNIDYWMQDADYSLLEEMVEGAHDLKTVKGPYGLCATNPVCVADVTGELQFLSRLTRGSTDFKDRVIFHRIGSMVGAPDGHMVDCFEVCGTDGNFYTQIFLDMYHYNFPNENTYIEGFDEKILPFCANFFGMNMNMRDFPENLAGIVYRFCAYRYSFPFIADRHLKMIETEKIRQLCKEMRRVWQPPKSKRILH